VEEILRVKDMDYAELRIRTSQLLAQANAIKKRLLEIEQKIQLDAEKRDVIGELQRIVAAFSRSGIPMAYVQHKFDSLVTMTQENLEIMDANFAIIPHPERPVSLQFYRVDEPGQVLFDHEKLSGGQKVRLSVAFLLAVQQLVVPDLGFLVLDEPSTHLDEESRENLKDLLLNLGQQLENTDTQILVCDHAQELQPAFFNTIEL
jgi:exonuclease SbcC